MKTSRRYVIDFKKIDWKKVGLDRIIDCRKGYLHAAPKDDDDFKDFKILYDNYYYGDKKKRGLYYETYKRLVATAFVLGY